ncbi:MAG: glycosyltransferase [Candidatus Undinarchaeales archaeon]|jgi:glycosyltransferase involved in cell wall biosynthesis|nr:glycosyltransferase [Candidatus Undinarchaeales archaeon]
MEKHAILGPYPPPYEGVGIVAKQEHERIGGLFIGTSKKKQKSGNIELVKKSKFGLDLPRLLWKIFRHKREIKVINAHFATTFGFVAYLAKKLFGISYTVTCHGSDILINLRKTPHKWLTSRALENADEILVVSRSLKKRIIGSGIKNTAIQIRRNKVGVEFKKMKIPKKKQIIAVGTVYPRKGYDILIKAFAQIAKKFPKHELVIVGRRSDSLFSRKLYSLLKKEDLTGRVRFLGEQRNIPKLLNESELFVMPSRSEGYGLSLAEALACGLDCVASKVGGIPEAAGKSRKCKLVSPGNINELAEAMESKLRNH